mmetsp:Transcript_15785/g.27967  ORF Transcript_15785/g.27967 Transcript_15785/m.27967 type:complete len:88 (-) Transcript_15785:503-766(-)
MWHPPRDQELHPMTVADGDDWSLLMNYPEEWSLPMAWEQAQKVKNAWSWLHSYWQLRMLEVEHSRDKGRCHAFLMAWAASVARDPGW